MSKSTISTFELFARFPDTETVGEGSDRSKVAKFPRSNIR